MNRFVAFLRGVNLGNRTVKSADLRAAFQGMGFAAVRTLLASGNVAFSTESGQGLESGIEKALQERFGFDVGTVLRSREQLQAMIDSDPFGGKTESDDLKLYVTMLREPEAGRLSLPCGLPGDFEVVRVTTSEIYHEAYRMPNGRYGAGAALIGKPFGKKVLWTNRNWNTIIKAVDA